MKFFVSGGAGFIGSHLVDGLIARGDDVVVVDDLSTGSRDNLSEATTHGARLLVEDIGDGDAMRSTIKREQPEVVFHLAAQIDVRASARLPVEDARINVIGTVNLLEAARAAGVTRFVFASTGAVYGEAKSLPVREVVPACPLSPYGQAKHAGEGYCDLYGRLYGPSTISLRLGNVYGPRQDPGGETGVVAIFCGNFLRREPPTVFGDGRQTRDYTYVSDVVEAMMRSAAGTVGGACNVGTGVETSVLELFDKVRATGAELGLSAGETFDQRFGPPLAGEVPRISLDPSWAREALGFEAKVDLRAGLHRTFEHLASGRSAE